MVYNSVVFLTAPDSIIIIIEYLIVCSSIYLQCGSVVIKCEILII